MLGLATSSQEAAMRRVRSLQALQYGGGIDLCAGRQAEGKQGEAPSLRMRGYG